MNFLNIGQIASATSTPAATVRYYEKIGLLPSPARGDGNYRKYVGEDVAKLCFVRRARDLGFSIDQIRSLLALSQQQEQDCRSVDELAATHLAVIEKKIADLSSLELHQSTLLKSCDGGTVAECRIIDALSM